MMEASTYQRSKNLEEKIPDIAKTLQMVEHLKELKVSHSNEVAQFDCWMRAHHRFAWDLSSRTQTRR